SRFGISSAKVSPLQTLVALYQAAQVKAVLPNSGKADRQSRNDKATAVSKATRDFVNANLRYNDTVTNDDRIQLGLTVPDDEPTEEGEIETMPVVDFIDTTVIRRVVLHFKDMFGKSRAKPSGVHGAEIRWAILAGPPKSMDELIHSEFSTRSHCALTFDEGQRSLILFASLRWENNRGRKGPWSEIYSAVIP
ncbi:MAG: hypothetical protein LBJ01_07960, partial [Tannerella sp.]|nr:hypothetical protein [Tannerella sp.]